MDDRTYVERVVRLSELVDDRGVLEGCAFDRCHITGPAIIGVTGKTTVKDCNLGGPTAEAVLWEFDPSLRPVVVGVLVCKDCTFDGCSFQNVGFAGPPELIQMFRAA
jgi:hypothetical protein